MKRTLSLLLVLVMVISMIPTVFAETDKPGIDFDDLEFLDDYSPIIADIAAGEEASFVWTATEEGTLTYEVPAPYTITVSQGDKSAQGSGAVSLDIVADEDVTIVVANPTDADVEGLIITGTLQTGHDCEANATVVPGKAATCKETGLTDGKICGICGEVLVAQKEIPLAEHVYEGEHFDGNPGYTQYTCAACGDTYKVDDEVPEVPALKIVTDIKNATGSEYGKNVKYYVLAEGGQGTLTYQWQKSTDDGNTWENLTTGKNYTVTSLPENEGIYRCMITDKAGNVVYSKQSKLTTFMFTVMPVDYGAAYANTKLTFTAETTGGSGELEYRWQKRRANVEGADWIWTNGYGTTYNPEVSKWTHYEYRCRVLDAKGKKIYSDVVGWELKTSTVTVTSEPVSALGVAKKEIVTFTAEGTTDCDYCENCKITYKWQKKDTTDPNAEWQPSKDGPVITIEAWPKDSGRYLYRCKIKDAHGAVQYTKSVYFNVRTVALEVKEVVDYQVTEMYPDNKRFDVTFDATATSYQGTVTYQWQKKKNGSDEWFNLDLGKFPSSQSAVLTFTTDKYDKSTWRCKVVDEIGVAYYTEEVTWKLPS